nr:ubiquitin carboxyl-terminal hydrolase 20-like [Tanacetum cinerariifolium]
MWTFSSESDNLVKQVFGGRVIIKQLSDTYEPSVDLSLEIDSLSTALESFTNVERIEDEEMKFRQTCGLSSGEDLQLYTCGGLTDNIYLQRKQQTRGEGAPWLARNSSNANAISETMLTHTQRESVRKLFAYLNKHDTKYYIHILFDNFLFRPFLIESGVTSGKFQYAMLYVTNVMQICNDTHEYDEARNIDKEEETAKERYGWREEVDVCGYGLGEEIG